MHRPRPTLLVGLLVALVAFACLVGLPLHEASHDGAHELDCAVCVLHGGLALVLLVSAGPAALPGLDRLLRPRSAALVPTARQRLPRSPRAPPFFR